MLNDKKIDQPKPGSKMAGLRAMRLAKFSGRREKSTLKEAAAVMANAAPAAKVKLQPQKAPAPPAVEQQETETVSKTATKRKAKTKSAKKASTERRKRPARAASQRSGVSGQAVADFMARKNGASMEELVKQFKIDAHPMRAKVFFVRHTLGYSVEHKDGRYFAVPPKAAK